MTKYRLLLQSLIWRGDACGRFVYTLAAAALLGLAIPQVGNAQTITPNAVCPRDSTGGTVDDGGGMVRAGTAARQYVVSFLSGNPASAGRMDTGTSGVDVATLRILSDRTDASACRALNSFMNGGASTEQTSPPWVYFRAGDFYFVARWTAPQPLSNYTIRHEGVMVFDLMFNLLGAWTA